MPLTDACAYSWPNQQCAIDHWGEDCRDVTTTKLHVKIFKEHSSKYFTRKRNGGCQLRRIEQGGGGGSEGWSEG